MNDIAASSRARRSDMPMVGLIIGLVVCCYAGTLQAPLIFDDHLAISDNPHVRHLLPISRALSAPPRNAVIGRPIVSLSLALNYAISGLKVWSYHLFNIVVHVLAALTLYGLCGRTMRRMNPALSEWRVTGWAAAIALLWGLHPLHTESVTYISNRTESMMGLMLLLTMYGAARGMASPRPARWFLCSAASCLTGMGCKEVMAAAPLLVLLYDRCFFSGSFGGALRRHGRLHLALFACWGALAVALAAKINLGVAGSAGFHFEGFSPLRYAAIQCGIVLHYLRLALWPHGLIIDYAGWPLDPVAAALVPAAAVWLAAAALTLWTLKRNRVTGFLGAWFLLILAPSSSFLPLPTELGAERRMYLPLAAMVVAAAWGAGLVVRRLSAAAHGARALAAERRQPSGCVNLAAGHELRSAGSWTARHAGHASAARRGSLGHVRSPRQKDAWRSISDATWACVAHRLITQQPLAPLCLAVIAVALIAALGAATVRRNHDYHSDVAIWTDAVAKRPNNARGRLNLANALLAAGQTEAGLRECIAALRLGLRSAAPHLLLAHTLRQQGQHERSFTCAQRALAAEPHHAKAHILVGDLLFDEGRVAEAEFHYEQACDSPAAMAVAFNNLGAVRFQQGRYAEALNFGLTAVHLEPELAEAHVHVANCLRNLGQLKPSQAHCAQALRLRPGCAAAHVAMGIALAEQGQLHAAARHFREALRSDPRSHPARRNLEEVLSAIDRSARSPEPQGALPHEPRAAPHSTALPSILTERQIRAASAHAEPKP